MSFVYEYTTTRRRIGEIEAPATSPDAAYQAVRDIGERERECLVVLLLNRKRRIIGREMLYTGTQSGSNVRIAELFTLAIRQGASAILLAHNHPSGDMNPSPDDLRTTVDAVAAGRLLGVPVIDHLIIGESTYRSMREQSGISFDD